MDPKAVSGGWAARKTSYVDKKKYAVSPPSLVKSLSETQIGSVTHVTTPLDITWHSRVSDAAEAANRGQLFFRGLEASQKSALVTLLRENSSQIKTLAIEESSIFSSGSNDPLVRMLELLVLLEELVIADSDVFDKLTAHLLAAVKRLPRLRKLSLVRVGCTKAISDDLRELCQTNTSLESIVIREEQVTEQYFAWTVSSAIGETRTSVSYYLAQNKQLRQLEGDSNRDTTDAQNCSLALSMRRLEEVPRSVFELAPQRLVRLDLSNNALTSLSDSVEALVNLVHLDLSCNQLSVLPLGLLHLVQLEWLNVAHNEIVELSEALGFLQKLSYLNVSCNRLRDLPLSLACMPKLREALLQNSSYPTNKFRYPQEVLDGGSLSILTHLKYNLKRSQKYNVAPVFFIGQHSSGNSRLVQMLSITEPGFGKSGSGLRDSTSSTSSGALTARSSYIGRTSRKSSYDLLSMPPPGPSSAGLLGKIHLRSGPDARRSVAEIDARLSSGSSDTNSSDSENPGADEGCFVETSLLRFQSTRSGLLSGSGGNSTDPVSPVAGTAISATGSVAISGLSGSGSKTDLSSAAAANSSSLSLSNPEIQIEAWDFSGHDLIPLFQREATAFVCTVNVSSERFSASVVLKLMQRITRHPTTRILLIGTHNEAALLPAKAQAVEAELDRIVISHPGLIVGKLVVSLKGDSKVTRKHLRDAISRIALESLRSAEVPVSWIVFGRMLVVLGQVKAVPVLTWEEVRSLALSCNIADSKIEAACSFLEKTGHVTFSDAPNSDWAIISPSWMATMWAPLRLLQTKAEHRGIVSADEVILAWQACKCPTWATRPWIALLKRLKMVLPIPKLRVLIVPQLMSGERPADIEARFWPAHCAPDQMQYSRVYTLSEPMNDEAVFSQLLLRLLRGNWKALCVWRSGMVLSCENELLLIEGNSSSTVVKMSVRATGVSTQLISLIFSLSSLLAENSPTPPVVEVPCIHCMQQRSYDPYMFSRAELEDAVASGKGVAFCRSVNPILIHSMAPDISMTGIAAHTIDHKDLGELLLIGEGGFAKVYKGKWRNSLVAVKKLLPLAQKSADADSSNATAEERRSLFSDFRREAWLMSGLEHPNLCVLKGVCLDPCFAIIMEYMNAGTLHSLLHNDCIHGPLPFGLLIKLALDIAKGMEFLHGITPPIVHRDLKSPNILLNVRDESLTVQITEFGAECRSLAALPANTADLVAKVSDFGLSTEAELAVEFKGTVVDNPTWTAPEMLARQKYNFKVDVYSFGVILWEMLERKLFFGEVKFMSELEDMVKSGKRPPIPGDCPVSVRILIETCWSQDPAKRPPFSDIRKMLQKVASDIGVEENKGGLTQSMVLKNSAQILAERRNSSSLSRNSSGGLPPVITELSLCEEFDRPQVLVPQYESSVSVVTVAGRHLWSGSSHGEILVFDLQTHVLIHQFQPKVVEANDPNVPAARKPGITAVRSLNHSVWMGYSDGSLTLWSRDLRVLKYLKKHPEQVTYLGSEGAETVVSACMAGVVRRWNIVSFKCTTIELEMPVSCMVQLGVNLVYGSQNNVFLLCPDKSTYAAPPGHTSVVHSVIVVRDQVWTASSDKTIRVWSLGSDARSLDAIKVLHGHSSRVFSLTSDLYCELVFSGSWDTQIMVWSVSELKFMGKIIQGHTDAVTQLAYVIIDDQEYLVSGAMDRQLIMYKRKAPSRAPSMLRASTSGDLKPLRTSSTDAELKRDIAAYSAVSSRTSSRTGSFDDTAPQEEETLRYFEFLTPAEQNYLIAVKSSSAAAKVGGARSRRPGSIFGSSSVSSANLTSPTAGKSGKGRVARLGDVPRIRSGSLFDISSRTSAGSIELSPGSSAASSIDGESSPPSRKQMVTPQPTGSPKVVQSRPRSHTMGAVAPPKLPLHRIGQAHDAPELVAPLAAAAAVTATTPERSRTPLGKLRGLFRRNSSAGSFDKLKKAKEKDEPVVHLQMPPKRPEKKLSDPLTMNNRMLSPNTGGSGSSWDDEGQESTSDDEKIVFRLERDEQ